MKRIFLAAMDLIAILFLILFVVFTMIWIFFDGSPVKPVALAMGSAFAILAGVMIEPSRFWK